MLIMPIHIAAKAGNIGLVKWLITVGGVSVEAKDSLGQTAAHHAALHDQVHVLRALADAGADLKAETPIGQTPMLWGCVKGNNSIVQYLVKEKGFTLTPRETSAAVSAKQILQGNVPPGMSEAVFNESTAIVKDAMKAMSAEEREKTESLEKHNDVLDYLGERICAHCRTVGASKRCTRCKQVRYCSVDCQRNHWAQHKIACSQP